MPKGKTSRPYNREEKKAVVIKSNFTKPLSVKSYLRSVKGIFSGESRMVAENILERRKRNEVHRKAMGSAQALRQPANVKKPSVTKTKPPKKKK